MKFTSDIDIDFADRDSILQHIKTTPSSIRNSGVIKKHNTGVHPTDIPYDPIHHLAALDYIEAQDRGYVKLDFLNVWVYKLVKSEEHLVELMREPRWGMLGDKEVFEKLIHIGKHWETARLLQEPINSIPRLAMFLNLIRPGKRHLIGKSWSDISKSIWDKDTDGYTFKKSHSVAYAMLVVVNMNLLDEQRANTVMASF